VKWEETAMKFEVERSRYAETKPMKKIAGRGVAADRKGGGKTSISTNKQKQDNISHWATIFQDAQEKSLQKGGKLDKKKRRGK